MVCLFIAIMTKRSFLRSQKFAHHIGVIYDRVKQARGLVIVFAEIARDNKQYDAHGERHNRRPEISPAPFQGLISKCTFITEQLPNEPSATDIPRLNLNFIRSPYGIDCGHL